MHFLNNDIKELDSHFRANLINSSVGIKQASLIGTINNKQQANLALFSSAVHLGSNPPLIAIFSRPSTLTPKQTLNNIISQIHYTINHVNDTIIDRSHSCSFKFSDGESEFEKCQLKEKFLPGFNAPFVAESNVSLAMKYLRHFPIDENGVIMVIGKLDQIYVKNNFIQKNGEINFSASQSVGVAGNNTYYSMNKLKTLEYISANKKNVMKELIHQEKNKKL